MAEFTLPLDIKTLKIIGQRIDHKGNITFSLNPFPHVIIKDALPVILADQLTSEFPIHAFDTSMNNKRKDISAIKVKNTENISTLWKEFIYYHSSHDFYKEVLQIFKPCFCAALMVSIFSSMLCDEQTSGK